MRSPSFEELRHERQVGPKFNSPFAIYVAASSIKGKPCSCRVTSSASDLYFLLRNQPCPGFVQARLLRGAAEKKLHFHICEKFSNIVVILVYSQRSSIETFMVDVFYCGSTGLERRRHIDRVHFHDPKEPFFHNC